MITGDLGASEDAAEHMSVKPTIQALTVLYALVLESFPLVTVDMLHLYMLMVTLVAASSAVGQCEANRGIGKDRKHCTLSQPAWIEKEKVRIFCKDGKN